MVKMDLNADWRIKSIDHYCQSDRLTQLTCERVTNIPKKKYAYMVEMFKLVGLISYVNMLIRHERTYGNIR